MDGLVLKSSDGKPTTSPNQSCFPDRVKLSNNRVNDTRNPTVINLGRCYLLRVNIRSSVKQAEEIERERFLRILSIECKDNILESKQTDQVEIRENNATVLVSIPWDWSKCFTLHALADLFIPSPTRLLWEAFSLDAIF